MTATTAGNGSNNIIKQPMIVVQQAKAPNNQAAQGSFKIKKEDLKLLQ